MLQRREGERRHADCDSKARNWAHSRLHEESGVPSARAVELSGPDRVVSTNTVVCCTHSASHVTRQRSRASLQPPRAGTRQLATPSTPPIGASELRQPASKPPESALPLPPPPPPPAAAMAPRTRLQIEQGKLKLLQLPDGCLEKIVSLAAHGSWKER